MKAHHLLELFIELVYLVKLLGSGSSGLLIHKYPVAAQEKSAIAPLDALSLDS